ncbi:galactose dehydrogenase [Kwoniella mangroviensis CBS 8886]|nr:galactose dehydrogenase [Kwoniella mangroviensis CBS 8886]
MSYLSPYHPDQPEPSIPPFDLSTIPDEDIDHPSGNDELLPKALKSPNDRRVIFPPLVLGCSTFGYGIYADDDNVKSSLPLRIVRLAMRCGINAFDTSPWYHPSEIVLGQIFKSLDYPRGSYHLITKVGKYGPNSRDHHFDPETITKSVKRSLKRMNTDYLDVVYLHDIEYILPPPSYSGNPLDSLSEIINSPSTPSKEEQILLTAIETLRSLQAEGKILQVGIAGYPLPILLRIALLVYQTSGKGLDVLQTYSHQTIQNSSLSSGYLQAFTEQAKVSQVVSAAPLSMGLLTSSGGPTWHPARSHTKLYETTRKVSETCQKNNTSIIDVSLRFGYRPLKQTDGKKVSIVVGCTELDQLRSTLRKWKEVNPSFVFEERERQQEEYEKQDREKVEFERELEKMFEDEGVKDWSWACPSDQQREG